MKKILTQSLCAFIFLISSTYSKADECIPSDSFTEEKESSEFVYIHQSKSGCLSAFEEGDYLLTLKKNNLNLVYFTDQPERMTGQKELSLFLESWEQSLKDEKHPPRAFINYTDFHSQEDTGVTPDVLELKNPQYDSETDTLTFQARPLHEHPIKQGVFENIVIIYDNE